jgi:hypothetical protein
MYRNIIGHLGAAVSSPVDWRNERSDAQTAPQLRSALRFHLFVLGTMRSLFVHIQWLL